MKKNIIVISLVVLVAILLGYIFGNRDSSTPTNTMNEQSDSADKYESTNDVPVKNLVSYTLPDSWSETKCSSEAETIQILPNGITKPNCNSAPEFSITIQVSNSNITECSQIQDVAEVRKHICKSRYINNLRSLEAETQYLESSVYSRETLVKTYYIDSGSGIIRAQFISAGQERYLPDFEDLVNSIKAKK